MERFAAEHELELPLGARQMAVAFFAMVTGLSLERLTQPDVVDADLGVQIQGLWFDVLARGAPLETRGSSTITAVTGASD